MHNIKNILRSSSAMIILLTLIIAGCRDDVLLYLDDEGDDPGQEVLMPISLEVGSIVTLNSVTRGEEEGNNNNGDDDFYPTVEPADVNILEDERRLHDFWILQYNAEGYRVGMPYYQEYTAGDDNPVVPILIPTKPGSKFTTVMIANSGDPSLFTDKNTATIRDLKNVHKPMTDADAVWKIIDDKKHLLMSGKTEVDINSSSFLNLNFHLRPNVAKLHLYFKLMKTTDGEGDAGGGNSWDRKRKTRAVNWGNVPDIPYADILYDSDSYNDEEHRFPSSVNPAKLNLFPLTTDKQKLNEIVGYALDMSDKPATIDVYLPRNTQGINQNTDPYQKSTYATDNALFLEIISSDKEETKQNKFRRIEFLPGANDVNDYNIIPGKYYDINFTFGNFPSDDGPVKKLYRRYGEANAYIVNPNDTRIINRFPISPVNNYATGTYPTWNKKNYWEETYYNIYLQELKQVNNDVTGKLTQDPVTWEDRDVFFTMTGVTGAVDGLSFAIMPSTQWVAEVIWQDRPERLINFCDYLGLPTHNGDYYESAGAMWLPVKIADLNNFKQTFLIKGGTTDVLDPEAFKDPYNDRNPTRSEIFFKTTGVEGNVVVGIRKKTDAEKAGGPPPALTDRQYLWSWHLWITNYNPAELGHKTMDRNIGAMTPDEPGFYYQYNRKDPFPHYNATVYDINGNELTQLCHQVGPDDNKISASMLCYQHDGGSTQKAIASAKLKGVNSPFTLIYHTYTSSSVTTTARKDYKGESGSAWPPTNSISSSTNWAIEDPSPQGWVLPPDEKQQEIPPGFWSIATSWQGLDIPAGGLRSDPYKSSDIDYLYRMNSPFLWLSKFGGTTVNTGEPGIAPNTSNNASPYYPEGYKMAVDALPVRCTKR